VTDLNTAPRSAAQTSELSLLLRLKAAFSDDTVVEAGRLLPERKLAQVLGVGRTALRQTLEELENEGLIWRRQGHGTFVSAVRPRADSPFLRSASETSPAELMEVRLEVEPILARLCALRGSREQVNRIRQAAVHSAESQSASAFEGHDLAFHRAVAEGANNRLFLAMFEAVSTVLLQADWRAVRQSTFSHSRRSEVSNQHDHIVQAITGRDPEAAEHAMRQHLESVYQHLQSPKRLLAER